MRSRVRFLPCFRPYAWHVEFKKDGWFSQWSQSGSYSDEASAVAAAKLFQQDELVWDSQADGGVES